MTFPDRVFAITKTCASSSPIRGTNIHIFHPSGLYLQHLSCLLIWCRRPRSNPNWLDRSGLLGNDKAERHFKDQFVFIRALKGAKSCSFLSTEDGAKTTTQVIDESEWPKENARTVGSQWTSSKYLLVLLRGCSARSAKCSS